MSHFQSKKTPGPDGFKPVLLVHLPPNVLYVLCVIYRLCLCLRYTPRLWKECHVIFLPKPGRKDYSHPSSYRPISLSNYLLKTLECLCSWHVEQCVRLSPLHVQQHGFRCDKSTETAASTLTDYVERHIYRRSHCLAAFLDIRSAFDSITPAHIHQSLC